MTDDRISKLPKWAQSYIHELEERTIQAEDYADALRVMIDGSPEVEPDLAPPKGINIVNGWLARRSRDSAPFVSKACTSSVSHSKFHWDETTTQQPISLFSSPSLALRALLPKILKAYADEITTTLNMIKNLEEDND